ncbi:MAG: ABC transporter permease [Thalassobaculaceae bacterium]|jgi:spermidine/putrescine transport system permease protein|tara:strand:+ start:368 stop:1255 length:888 start_codon:yes stop_codon:yes gene_type:complete
MMKSARNHKLAFWLTFCPPTLWMLIFLLVPILIIGIFSFSAKQGLVDISASWVLDNYIRAYDPVYLSVFFKSIGIAALTTLICFLIGFPVAIGIASAPKSWKPVLLMIVVLPFWVNLLIRTYALIAVFRTRGFFNFSLEWVANLFGIPFEPLTLLYNDAAVILGLVYIHLPFMILPLYAGFEGFNKSLLEAASDLGAQQFKIITAIVLPIMAPSIISGCILVFIPALGSFLTPELLGGPSSQMIANVIERQFLAANDWPFGSALSMMLIYLTFGALALRYFWLRRRYFSSTENKP